VDVLGRLLTGLQAEESAAAAGGDEAWLQALAEANGARQCRCRP
jgi:hypothetical protein